MSNFMQDQDANKKKRKKCPLTKERRAKKKVHIRVFLFYGTNNDDV